MTSCAFHYQEYACQHPELIDLMISHYPLALISSECQGTLQASHVPLFRDADRSLFGHVDRRNPQFQGRDHFRARLVFMGPQSYIPPEAYRSRQLPTWNYVAVHMEAQVQVVDDPVQAGQILGATAARLQPKDAPYQYDAADPRIAANLPHILGLRIRCIHEEGRFKLSQDKGEADRAAALDHLLRQNAASQRELLGRLMNFPEFDRRADG